MWLVPIVFAIAADCLTGDSRQWCAVVDGWFPMDGWMWVDVGEYVRDEVTAQWV